MAEVVVQQKTEGIAIGENFMGFADEHGDSPDELWCIEANVKMSRGYGEGPADEKPRRNGVRLYRGGAKVYIIGAYYGTCENVVVVGHHRKSVKVICSVLKASYLENFRLRPVYKESVKRIALEQGKLRNGAHHPVDNKEAMAELVEMIPNWV